MTQRGDLGRDAMSNEQRAAEDRHIVALLDDVLSKFGGRLVTMDVADALVPVVRSIADAAEARGRADVEAKVRELADRFEGYDHDHGIGDGHERCPACWVDDLRALVATGTDRDEGR